jgi:hypothetical protein
MFFFHCPKGNEQPDGEAIAGAPATGFSLSFGFAVKVVLGYNLGV